VDALMDQGVCKACKRKLRVCQRYPEMQKSAAAAAEKSKQPADPYKYFIYLKAMDDVILWAGR
jgi:hypothetical protein